MRPSQQKRNCSGTSPRGWIRTAAGWAAWLALLGCGGCGPAPSDTAPAPAPAATPSPPAASTAAEGPAAAAPRSAQPQAPPEGGTWYVSFIDGSKVGYERTETTEFTRDDRPLLRVEVLSHVAVKRFGERIEQEMRFTSIETPDGKLLEFEGELSQGPLPLKVAGRVVGEELQIETTTKGKTVTASIPWSAEYGGLQAAEQSLAREPMKPGEQRTIQALVPGFNVLGTSELAARDYEPVELLTGTYELLRIDTTTSLPVGEPIRGTVWADRSGEILKNRLELMKMSVESIRATRAEALEESGPAELDLGLDVAVEVDRPLPVPHETKRVRYRVELEDGDPAGVFVSGPSQQVESMDPKTAEVTVYAIRPDTPLASPAATEDTPAEDDRKPNSLIQSDYPAITAKARQVAPEESDPWFVALALERCVGELIHLSGYSQAFATAAEVMDSGEGDCTEHAVLLAALARARGIPARVAIGLVYKDRAFYYHMWTEVYVADRWIPLDATLARGGIGAAHLKMAHSSLAGPSALSTFLPILRVIGRLKIEILEVE